MKLSKVLSMVTLLLIGIGVSAAIAMDGENENTQGNDFTSSIVNADFASMEGWTEYVSGSFRDFGNGLIGTYRVRTDDFIPAATLDETHLATEYCIGLEARWEGNFASYNQDVMLPAGNYKLTFDVENVNAGTTSANYNNLFKVTYGETEYVDESTEWMKGMSTWTAHKIVFKLQEETTVNISLGYGTGSNNFGSANTPALYVSHLSLKSISEEEFLENGQEQQIEDPVADPLFDDDTYYIYNIGVGKYLSAGSSWGTKAIVDEVGLDYNLAFNDGKYTIDSQIANGSIQHYLNGEWNDGVEFYWTFKEVGEGIYTISNGNSYLAVDESGEVVLSADTTLQNQWQLKTLDNRLDELAQATVNAPVDATFLIKDPNFGRNDTRKVFWNIEANNYMLSGGDNVNNNAESYHSLFTLSQTLNYAPAGRYAMTVQGFYRPDVEGEVAPVFFANEVSVPFPLKTGSENSMSAASQSFTEGLYTIDPLQVFAYEDGGLTIGAKSSSSNQWVIWDNFRLMYYGNQIDLSEIEESYRNAISNAQSLLDDEAYVNVKGEERNELAQAIVDYSQVDTSDQEAMMGASNELARISTIFTTAALSYNAFAAIKASISMADYPYASQYYRNNLNTMLLAEPENAEEAASYTEELTYWHRMYAYSNSRLEGVDDVEDMTDYISNPTADDLTYGWDTILGEDSGGEITVLSNERPNYGDNVVYYYFDGGNWAESAWDVTFQQYVSLPKGKYMLSVMSRASENMAIFRLFAGTESIEMTHIGAQNGVYGKGWNDTSLTFELEEETTFPIGVQGVANELHQWMSFTNFRLMRFPDNQEITDAIDVTDYILNSSFDVDLTFQADGKMKDAVSTDQSLSDRSWAYIAADSTVYARPKDTSSQSRPDGRKMEAVNGFWGHMRGWTLETSTQFPKCEWTYFGSVAYDLEETAVPISDDGNTYITVPERPMEFEGGEGFVYLRAGWGNSAVYKQVVQLPCAKYRLEYWTINLNPNASVLAKDLTQIKCRNEVFKEEEGSNLNEQVWTKHEFEFIPTSEFTMQFGFQAANSGSGSQPIVALDGIKLYKIGEAESDILQKQDLIDLMAELEAQMSNAYDVGMNGVANDLNNAYFVAQDAYENIESLTYDERESILKSCRTTIEQSVLAMSQMNNIIELISRMQNVAETTSYEGIDELWQAIDDMSYLYTDGSAEDVNSLYRYGQDALKAYYLSQQPTADSPADYTYLITHPWFIDEKAEPYSDGDGGYFFPNSDYYVEGGSNDVNTDLTMQGWIWWRHGYGGYDMRTNWAQGRSCFNAWFNTAQNYRASIVQDLTNIPEGYYTLSADMITQEGCVTNQHVFATYTSYNLDAYAPSFDSPSLTKAGWSDDGNSEWTTLTTPVFYVGADGLLTIGARGTHPLSEDSVSSSAGWFLVTNFKLNYYGMTPPEMPEEDNMLYVAEGTKLAKTNISYIPVSLKNTDDIMGFQLDVVLPEGMTIANGASYLDDNRSYSHQISYNQQSDGSIRMIVSSWDNEIFSYNDGVVLNIGVNIPSYMSMGDYAVTLKNVIMTNSYMKTIKCTDKTFVVSLSGIYGDVNSDEQVNVTDVVMMIDYILERYPQGFNTAMADVTGDGEINITDVVTVIDVILGRTVISRSAAATNHVGQLGIQRQLNMVAGETTAVPVSLTNLTTYSAFQMDVTLPAGLSLEKVAFTERAAKSHQLTYSKIADGKYRIVGFSLQNEGFNGESGDLLQLSVKSDGSSFESGMHIDEITFVTPKGTAHNLMAVDALGEVTGIATLNANGEKGKKVYDLQGRQVEKTTKGLYIVNGKKSVKK